MSASRALAVRHRPGIPPSTGPLRPLRRSWLGRWEDSRVQSLVEPQRGPDGTSN
jgi:hypothetical protein